MSQWHSARIGGSINHLIIINMYILSYIISLYHDGMIVGNGSLFYIYRYIKEGSMGTIMLRLLLIVTQTNTDIHVLRVT